VLKSLKDMGAEDTGMLLASRRKIWIFQASFLVLA
jgi:hypothetical protein